MALALYGGGIIGMSGSIAGNTHSHNRYGNYIRAKTKPTNPNTARQQVVKSAVAFLADRWANTLTAVQRTAWNLYGSSVARKNKLGADIYLTGYNHYMRSNVIRKQIVATIIDDAPTVFEIPGQDPTLTVTTSETTQLISCGYDALMDWADENGAYLIFFQGQPQNPQRNFFGGPWRICGIVPGVNGAPPASPKLNAAVFAVAELQHQWIYARIARADGRISEPFRADCFCAA